MVRICGIRCLYLSIQLPISGAENTGEGRSLEQLARGADLAQTGTFPKQGDEALALLTDVFECEPLSQNDGPGKKGKGQQQQ
jgi:hypothetical protein